MRFPFALAAVLLVAACGGETLETPNRRAAVDAAPLQGNLENGACTPLPGGDWSCPGPGVVPACPPDVAEGYACAGYVDTTNPAGATRYDGPCLVCVDGVGTTYTCSASNELQPAGTYSCGAAVGASPGGPADAAAFVSPEAGLEDAPTSSTSSGSSSGERQDAAGAIDACVVACEQECARDPTCVEQCQGGC